MAIPANIIFAHPGTAATIDSNWERVTAMDSKFVLSTSFDDAGGTGGHLTHDHDFSSAGAHTHNMSAGAASGTVTGNSGSSFRASSTHTHASTTSGDAVFSNLGTSNLPKHKEVIWIKSKGTGNLPVGDVAFFDATPSDTDWKFCDGTSSTPDFRNMYLRGAAASSDPGPGLASGVESHTHDLTHTHAAKNSQVNTGRTGTAGSGYNAATHTHTHSIELTATSITSVANTDDSYPGPRHKLGFFQNRGSAAKITDGMIGYWLGLDADVPANWEKQTYTELWMHLIGANDATEFGNEDPVTTHAHNTNVANHTHGSTAGSASALGDVDDSGVVTVADFSHTHTWTISTLSSWGAMTNASGESIQPPFILATAIKYVAPAVATIIPQLSLLGVL